MRKSSKKASPSVSSVSAATMACPLRKTLGVELGVRSAEARADDHAELACAAQADDQLVAERCGVRRHELYLQDALEVCGDGVLERGSRQSLVAFGAEAGQRSIHSA